MTIILLAGRITKVCGLVLYIIVGLTVGEMSPNVFGLFGGATLLLAHRRILVAARKPFDKAVEQRPALLAGRPPHTLCGLLAPLEDADGRCCLPSFTRN